MKCIDCGATGYGLHHSAACEYLNIDVYARVEKLQKQSDLLTLGLLQEKGKVAELLEACKNLVRGQLQHPTFKGYVEHAVWVAQQAIAEVKGK